MPEDVTELSDAEPSPKDVKRPKGTTEQSARTSAGSGSPLPSVTTPAPPESAAKLPTSSKPTEKPKAKGKAKGQPKTKAKAKAKSKGSSSIVAQLRNQQQQNPRRLQRNPKQKL